jgi:hypothetical protein
MSRISVKDAARQLGLSEDSVLRRIRDKRLVGILSAPVTVQTLERDLVLSHKDRLGR